MKKTFLMALVLLMVVSTVGLFSAGRAEATVGRMRVAVSLPPANNAWQARLLDNVLAETAKDADEFVFEVKNAVDDADQYNMLQTFKDGGYDMIIVLPGNGTLMTPICEEIYNAGTKLMVLDRPIESSKYTALLAGDNYGAGVNGANYIGERLGGRGQIAVLRSYVGSPIDLERYSGFMDTLKAKYPGIRVLVEGDGEFNQEAGLRAMSNILPAYPHIDAVFCQDDETAIGALIAIESARRTDIQFVTGMGGAKNAYDRMIAGDTRYGASMSYFTSMGGDGIRLAKSILRGESFEKDNLSPSYIVTGKNVADYMHEAY